MTVPPNIWKTQDTIDYHTKSKCSKSSLRPLRFVDGPLSGKRRAFSWPPPNGCNRVVFLTEPVGGIRYIYELRGEELFHLETIPLDMGEPCSPA